MSTAIELWTCTEPMCAYYANPATYNEIQYHSMSRGHRVLRVNSEVGDVGALPALIVPTSQSAADELRRQILEDLPKGFQAKLYEDLYNAGHRIETAKREGESWYRGLTK